MSPFHIASRVAASLLGGYAFVWGFATLGIAILLLAGMPYDDARTLCFLLAFLVFLACFCWAYVPASLARVWGVLAGGGAAMTTLAWLLLRATN
ncbi:iron uptake protein [Variovorax sp.]|uniref:iron uptake protein n=1 Tax=Variovorax sp. TaxID=1871043 RepID=UPI002D27FE32|nr:iron uptake protein [Variovorax sp.]HYP85440.1 iron uptake protein [Variovorax sp.]